MAASNPIRCSHHGDSWLDLLDTIKTYHLAVNYTELRIEDGDGALLYNLTREVYGILDPETLSNRDIAVLFFYSLVVGVSLLGNTLVCHVVFRYRTMRTTTNAFIANLAVSDLLMTVLNIPFNLARLLLRDWPFGTIMCGVVPFVQVTSAYVSAFTMAFISVHRYKVITDPFASRLSGCRSIATSLVSVWIIACVLSLPHAIFNTLVEVFTYKKIIRCQSIYPQPEDTIRRFLTIFTFASQYILPLTITGITYAKVVRRVWSTEPVGAVTEEQAFNRAQSKKTTIKMLILVVIVFALCWLPLNLYHVVHEFDHSRLYTVEFFVCHWLAMSSVCYNPFIYCWLNKNFRSAFTSLFCCRGAPNTSATTSLSSFQSSRRFKYSVRRASLDEQCDPLDSAAPFNQDPTSLNVKFTPIYCRSETRRQTPDFDDVPKKAETVQKDSKPKKFKYRDPGSSSWRASNKCNINGDELAMYRKEIQGTTI